MAQIQWAERDIAATALAGLSALPRRLAGRLPDWEDALTFVLAFGAVLGVTLSIEGAGWTDQMPSLTLVGFLALAAGLFIARALPALIAWPLAAVLGAAVVFWQALEVVGGGDLGARIDAIYLRFQTWFDVAFDDRISNDPLPFVVMVVGLTWLGVFFFGWCLYRWHNAWPGLVPGGLAVFMNLLFVEDGAALAVLLYVACGFLLLMRTHLTGQIRAWRSAGVEYPPFLSLSYLHFTGWAVLLLLFASWIAPAGWAAPSVNVPDALTGPFEGVAVHFVRLAGPLHVKKIVPLHDYTSVLPFQGSIDLRERELLSVRVDDPTIRGPLLLRGAVYDEYASGGWKAGRRVDVDLPSSPAGVVAGGGIPSDGGRLVPLVVTVEAKSVVGTVLFVPGQFVSASGPLRAKVLPEALLTVTVDDGQASSGRQARALERTIEPALLSLTDGGASLSDAEVAALVPAPWITVDVRRERDGRVAAVRVAPGGSQADPLVVAPEERLARGESYGVLGLVRDAPADALRQAGSAYPSSVRDAYLGQPQSLPTRVHRLAFELAGAKDNPYDRAKAIETYLREFPVDYGIADTPPGRDTVDYFLFDARRGYFDYHASAMVVMLRALGVPARLAVGFALDERDRDAESGRYVVEDRDAYAWAEVYFPGYGWVEFNPTPDRPAVLRPGEAGADGPALTPDDLASLRDLPISADVILPQPDIAGGGAASRGDGGGSLIVLWAVLAVAGVLAASAGSAALGWRRSVAGLPYPQQLWEKTVRLAGWAGLGPAPGQTPSEFARSLDRRLRSVRDIEALAEAYNRSRFGRKETPQPERERLEKVWAHLRALLAGEVILRLWRRR